MGKTLWVDALAGVAGDMLAGALIDAGVPLEVMADAVTSVLPGAVTLTAAPVTRAGLHAMKFDVEVLEVEPPHRHLTEIRRLVLDSTLDNAVADRVLAVFDRIAAAEAGAHGIDIDAVHFHEVGAADSIADIVSVCAGLVWLDVADLVFSDIALGSGTVRTQHGELPVPTPAALRLTRGLRVLAAGNGELATPTGIALLVALGHQAPFPQMRVLASGSGGGTKDFADHPNVVRVVAGETDHLRDTLLIEANVDDMDPRLWPAAIEALLSAGANDAWLTPIVMKKGRPAHTLSVLCTREHIDLLLETMFRNTTTIGARVMEIAKVALDRRFERVEVDGQAIAVKLAGRHGRVYNVSLEFEDIARAAIALDLPQREVLRAAEEAAQAVGLVVGAEFERD